MSRMTGDMEAIRQLTCDGTINLTKIFFYLFLPLLSCQELALSSFC